MFQELARAVVPPNRRKTASSPFGLFSRSVLSRFFFFLLAAFYVATLGPGPGRDSLDHACALLVCSGPQKVKDIEKVMDRDFYMTAQEAVDFGVVDKILAKRPREGVGSGTV